MKRKELVKLSIDKRNGDLCYDDANHVYWNASDMYTYISSTTLIGKFEQPFDRGFWLKYKALQALANPGRDFMANLRQLGKFDDSLVKDFKLGKEEFDAKVGEIAESWKKANKDSCDKGTARHEEFENRFSETGKYKLDWYGYGNKLFTYIKGEHNIHDDLENQALPEMLISMRTKTGLRVAGQIDLGVKRGMSFRVIDYKGFPLDTPILTSEGWKKMGELKQGMEVFDNSGNLCKIKHVSEIHYNPCYEITFDNGEKITCDNEHMWYVKIGGKIHVASVKEMLRIFRNGTRMDIELCRINCNEENPLKKYSYFYINGLISMGRRYELSDEEMNGIALSPVRQRESALTAFIDIVGNKDGDTVTIRTDREWMRKVVPMLVASLGYKPFISKDEVWYNTEDKTRTITDIKDVKTVPTICIETDSPTSSYLVGKTFILTHNTNKKLNFESYADPDGTHKMMKAPLEHIMDCNVEHYKLQVALYSLMVMRRYPQYIIKNPVIIHLDGNLVHRYQVDVKKAIEDAVLMCKAFVNDISYQYSRVEYDGKDFWLPVWR